ncbi:hypothetical protein, partial [Acetobacter orleanensis]|uniref:hypothetical protein n=1 Tax=Acetobacter orleanensis TaxID=104099 RepID=UPI00222EBD6C
MMRSIRPILSLEEAELQWASILAHGFLRIDREFYTIKCKNIMIFFLFKKILLMIVSEIDKIA